MVELLATRSTENAVILGGAVVLATGLVDAPSVDVARSVG
jgi:hypothetical protein